MSLRFLSVVLLFCLWVPLPAAEPQLSLVFKAKEGGYEEVRTPQLLVTQSGTFLAFAQGRSGQHDRSDNDIILKRSTDGGQTWSPFQVIVDQGKDTLNSICVIQLRETGRILVVGCWMPDGYEFREFQYLSPALQEYQKKAGREKLPAIRPGYEGRDVARNYLIFSDDEGKTWSPMRDITREVKRPTDVMAIPGPGVAIQLHEGAHAGRIIVPCFAHLLDREVAKPAYLSVPYAIFSDDAGQTWKRGELAPAGDETREKGGDESQVVELPGGALLLNTRSVGRNIAVSSDGGQSWSPLQEELAIKTSPTAAGFIRYSGIGDGDKSRLLFTNPTELKRSHGVLTLSYDDGKTWHVQRTLREGRFKYSGLARLPDGQIGCIFDGVADKGELPKYQGASVLLARIPLEWLTQGKDQLK